MAVPSLLVNHHDWKIQPLTENAFILKPIEKGGELEKIHQLYRMLICAEITGMIDLVPAYESLTVFWDTSLISKEELVHSISNLDAKAIDFSPQTFRISVDYSTGLDWERVEEITKLDRNTIIQRHSKTIYTVAMIGFLPGFIFLDGLDPSLAVPRLEMPRNNIPAGSIGIGGSQTGMYSLASAGGWNIIGTSTNQFFNANQHPPISIMPGDQVVFMGVK